ncbi:hypothetical protein FRC07_012150 [Ceratobasidium sp. 392]|nr:hypothetical protein FRC07_012150 [Ceratobasidium sp. 392]
MFHLALAPHRSLHADKERRRRVLVIRKPLNNLVTAANPAEIDMCAQKDDCRQRKRCNTRPNPAAAAADLIDPAEAVNLPSCMFPVQSLLAPFGGLSVDNSVGAATLADALPPRAGDMEDEGGARRCCTRPSVGARSTFQIQHHHPLSTRPYGYPLRPQYQSERTVLPCLVLDTN